MIAAWPAILIGAAVVAAVAYAVAEVWTLKRYGPRDATANGITIGRVKAFDNRSLALRIERLSAGLSALKIVNQNVTDHLATLQGQTSSESTQSLKLEVRKGATAGGATAVSAKAGAPVAAAAPPPTPGADAKPAIGLAAGDVLNDQLDLASQIVNLQLLYERSLTDRLIGGRSRLQTVLGFQISITPPAGYENCTAICEIAVRMTGNDLPVSLVALIPQEKTYNAQSISSSAHSIEGSAVAEVVNLGFTSKGESRQLFVHRDSDTIAFERDPESLPLLFEKPGAVVFGWEFRPVLGRTTVSAGTRQMLAVVAVPVAENNDPSEVELEIASRSYWRRYDRKRQTSRPFWGPLPWRVDRSNTSKCSREKLTVPNIAKIQHALAPKIRDIRWVNAGPDNATVIVKGSNFFSGTQVAMGGKVHAEDGTLTLKSDQALEFSTSLAALATGGAVLSGRFGSSVPLVVPADRLPAKILNIQSATIHPIRYAKTFQISIDVKAPDWGGEPQDIDLAKLTNLPEPLLLIDDVPVPMPYSYFSAEEPVGTPVAAKKSEGEAAEPPAGAPPPKTTRTYVQVTAMAPASMIAGHSSISFRIPFCGVEFESSTPFSAADPSIDFLGVSGDNSVFRFANPVAFAEPVSAELDQIYRSSPGSALSRTGAGDYRFVVPTEVVSRFVNVVLRAGKTAFSLRIPREDDPARKAVIDADSQAPQLAQNGLGPVVWTGANLNLVTVVTLHAPLPDGATKPAEAAGVEAQFAVSGGGKRIEVYFKTGSTAASGMAEVEFKTVAGDAIRRPLFITA